MRGLARWLGQALAAEQDQLFLWLPVLFGAGILTYFAWPSEPALLPLLGAAAVALALALAWRRGLASLVVGGALTGFATGLAAAKIASDLAAAPVLAGEQAGAELTGWVELVEPRARGGERLVLRLVTLQGVAPETTPRRVRLTVPAGGHQLVPGDAVKVRARLLPPGGPALPGAYDFARSAWFLGIGAVGFASERPVPAAIGEPLPLALRLWLPVERLRQVISRRITAALPGEAGAIAAALVTGERGGITEATNQAYRDSGLFHILSISGLHMTIFAGAVYFASRLALSLVPLLALCFDIKKWAAAAGLLGTGGYLLISGGSPPAVRSAIMLAVMFVAAMLERPALALRNVAVAALIILVLAPQSVIDVGFQMSFAAVVALVAGIEAWRVWRHGRDPAGSGQRAFAAARLAIAFLGTIALTTLIATAAVAPFAAYYFHKSTQYGVIANLVAVPVCNLLVMPAALATLLAMPLGLEAWPLWLMGRGIDAMTWVAYRVGGLPGAVALVPAIPALAFGLMVAGGLWLALWRRRWRLLGLLAIIAGLAVAPWRTAPDIFVGAGGMLVAVRGPDGRLAALDLGRSSFELARWLEHDADPRAPGDVGPGRLFVCDPTGCRVTVREQSIAVARHPAALAEDCRRARLVLWLGEGPARCPGPMPPAVITREAVRAAGTHAIYLGSAAYLGGAASAGIVVETVGAARGLRPWSQARQRERQPRATTARPDT